MFFPNKAFFSTSLSYTNFLLFLLFSLGSCPNCSVTCSSYSMWNVVRYIKTGVKTLFAHSNSKSIINSFSIFLYYLDSEQWYLAFTYLLFQIHFPTDSLLFSSSHLNIISSFILYSFFNNYTSSNIFFIQYLIIIIEKNIFEEWTVAHQTWWATVHKPKKISGIESLLESHFVGLLSIIESILCLESLLEML